MTPTRRLALVATLAACFAGPAFAAEGAGAPRTGDHVAIIGGGLADRMQHDGTLEAMLSKTYPQYDLVFRNLGFAGDEVEERMRSEAFGSPEDWLKRTKADVVWGFFGFNEAFAGKEGVAAFKGKLLRLAQQTLAANYNGKGAPRLVLFTPIAAEKGTDPDWADPAPLNANLALYSAAVIDVATELKIPVVDLFAASQKAYASAKKPLTVNGLHVSDEGYETLAPAMYQALLGTNAPAVDADLLRIRAAVRERNQMWFSRYRTVDGYNVYGGRSNLTFDGVTNQKVMQEEMAVRDVMTANRDAVVWAAAKGKAIKPDDSNLPSITKVKTNKPNAAPYLSGEDGIAKMTVPTGVKVNLFASEEQFPELVNPVQMAWDVRGRLWVCAWKTYPGREPSDTKGDSLLMFEDTNGDGKADKCVTFLDDLNCPTGFQFVRGGVVVMQAPDLWFVAIDAKTGLAGAKTRVLTGLDSADSHHQTNAMCLEPGGATYLSDGVFHRTQVETGKGVVRNSDGAIYRYEPRSHRFERYIAYGFANPHGRVFDRWGNDFVTDATGNNNYFGPAISTRIDGTGSKHPGIQNFWPNPSRPCPGTGILSSEAWPAEYQGSFLNLNVISFQGIYRAKVVEDGGGLKGESVEHLLQSSDPNCRPIAVAVGPDGALYMADWSQSIIGHMQHHLRDPVRDHTHGRIYRLTHEGKTVKPAAIFGQSIPALLDLLKSPTDTVRERAKIELGDRDTTQVMTAVDKWVATLDAKDAEYQHHVTEALWVKQWHNVVDQKLLKQQLRAPDHRARAAATRVLCYQRDRVPEALALLKVQAADEHARVRLEAVRALSFFEQWEAADAALASLKYPTDYYLTYVLKETMRQLTPWWKPAIGDGKAIAADNPAGIEFILAGVATNDLAKLPKSDGVWQAMFARTDASTAMRQEALQALATSRKATPLATLLGMLKPLIANGGRPLDDACRMLVQQPAADLATGRTELSKLAAAGNPAPVRQAAIAALMTADGSVDGQWSAAASTSLDTVTDLLNAVALLSDAKLKTAAAAKVIPLLGLLPPELAKALAGQKGASGRYVRVQLPRKGTLTLAEVEVFSGGKNIATAGTAKQSSTGHGGDAKRAIDGRTDGSFGAGTSTHTDENEDKPWWEVDLGSAQSVEAVKVWNRTDGDLGNRLDGFVVTVLDGERREISRSASNANPKESTQIALAGDPAGGLRRAAITAALATGAEPKAVASALAGLLANGEQVPAAAQALKQLPKDAWPKDKAAPAVAGVASWARAIPVAGRTSPAVVDTLAVADSLAGLLGEAEAKTARADLANLSVRSIVIKTVRELMKYDTPRWVVEAGKPLEIVLTNEDMMPHNLVLVTPGARQEVAIAAQTMKPDEFDAQGRSFVPKSDKILGATKLVNPGKSERLMITVPTTEGQYEYVCTFPGHWTIMWGTLVVTKDPAQAK